MRGLSVSLSLAVGLAACGYTMPAPSRELPAQPSVPSAFRVGTARVDVTPPPGVSTFGHAADAEVTDGVWTRLYCRVFAFKTERGERLALVPCDLAAVSTLLQRSVAERLHDVLPATRLMLSATHTHAGPAHYFDSEAFNDAFSAQMPGFDPKMVDFLAERIADGVREAFASARPAGLRSAHFESDPRALGECSTAETCSFCNCGMWGVTWNRSIAAHRRNHFGSDGVAPPALPEVERAIDPELHVLEIDALDAKGAPAGAIGALAFFAMHPTVLPHENRLLGADTHGVISRRVESWLRDQARAAVSDPLFGIFNTNEGDIAPRWFEGTKSEAIAVGTRVADRILALLRTTKPDASKSRITLDVRYREVDLPRARAYDGAQRGELCELAEPGESFAHGACDHPGDFNANLLLPGPPYGGNCQTPKRGLASSVGVLLAGGSDAFPRRVPLGLVQLDDSLIAFAPAELTIAAGAQVRSAIRAARRREPDPGAHVFVAGLSNGYMLYVTSKAEFEYHGKDGGCAVATAKERGDRQSYEGGSNLYGPYTAAFFAEQFGLLARSLRHPDDLRLRSQGPAIGEASAFRVVPGIERPRLAPKIRAEDPPCADAKPMCVVRGTRESQTPNLCFRFHDAPPGARLGSARSWLRLLRKHGHRRTGIDDRGIEFVTRVLEVEDGEHARWAAVLRLAPEQWRALGRSSLVFSVGDALFSPEFSSDNLPPECPKDADDECQAFDAPPAKNHPFPGTPPLPPAAEREGE